MRTRSILPLLVVAMLAGCASSTPQPVYPPFAGSWLYDYETSVNDANTIAESVPQDWRSGLKKDEDKFRDRVDKMLRPPEMIVIEIMRQKMFVTGGAGFKRVYNLDGTAPAPNTTNRLEGWTLTSEVLGADFKIVETWELSRGGTVLVLSQRVDSQQLSMPLTIRSTYDIATKLPH